jgi:hypothetical protein
MRHGMRIPNAVSNGVRRPVVVGPLVIDNVDTLFPLMTHSFFGIATANSIRYCDESRPERDSITVRSACSGTMPRVPTLASWIKPQALAPTRFLADKTRS